MIFRIITIVEFLKFNNNIKNFSILTVTGSNQNEKLTKKSFCMLFYCFIHQDCHYRIVYAVIELCMSIVCTSGV